MNVSADPVNPLTHPRSELAAQHLQKTYGKHKPAQFTHVFWQIFNAIAQPVLEPPRRF